MPEGCPTPLNKLDDGFGRQGSTSLFDWMFFDCCVFFYGLRHESDILYAKYISLFFVKKMSNPKKNDSDKTLIFNVDPGTLLFIVAAILLVPLVLAGFLSH
jgi:hypothetical protein